MIIPASTIEQDGPGIDLSNQPGGVTAGFYESRLWNRKYPKMQFLTVEDLLAGKQIEMPPIRQAGATFKKAPKAPAPNDGKKQLSLFKNTEPV